jgi:hypothetical protein
MTEDTETEAANAEGYAGWDLDDIFIVVGVSIIAVVGLAFWLYSHEVAQVGVGLVSSFTAPVSAGFNGLASLINAFFQWAAHAVSNLFTLGFYAHAFRQIALAKQYASQSLGMRLHLSVFTESGYAAIAIAGA